MSSEVLEVIDRVRKLYISFFVFVATACAGTGSHTPLRNASQGERAIPTCLALSAGGPAGLAHVGAIAALKRRHVEISCVVGSSMGALVGVLHAAHPRADTVADALAFLHEYRKRTEEEARHNAGRGALTGLIFLGPVGALLGGAAGAASTSPLDHARVVATLNDHINAANVERLAVPFRTNYILADPTAGVRSIEVQSGSAAEAVGASVANPLIFRELDPRQGGPIDPGVDRLAAVPVEQTCDAFPGRRIIAINVTSRPAVVSRRTTCEFVEIAIAVPAELGNALKDPESMARVIALGQEAVDHWAASPQGDAFIQMAARTRPQRGSSTDGVSLMGHGAPGTAPRWLAVSDELELASGADGELQGIRVGGSAAARPCTEVGARIARELVIQYAKDRAVPESLFAKTVEGRRISLNLGELQARVPPALSDWTRFVRRGRDYEVVFTRCDRSAVPVVRSLVAL